MKKKNGLFVRPAPKTFTLRVRMTPDEVSWLRDLSEAAGVTASQYELATDRAPLRAFALPSLERFRLRHRPLHHDPRARTAAAAGGGSADRHVAQRSLVAAAMAALASRPAARASSRARRSRMAHAGQRPIFTLAIVSSRSVEVQGMMAMMGILPQQLPRNRERGARTRSADSPLCNPHLQDFSRTTAVRSPSSPSSPSSDHRIIEFFRMGIFA